MIRSLAFFASACALLAACSSINGALVSAPPESQLATACNGIAAAYNTAAGYRAQGKLSAQTVSALIDMETPVKTICDPMNPPANMAAALADANTYLQTIALINAGVK